jgi:hypothetical protein
MIHPIRFPSFPAFERIFLSLPFVITEDVSNKQRKTNYFEINLRESDD